MQKPDPIAIGYAHGLQTLTSMRFKIKSAMQTTTEGSPMWDFLNDLKQEAENGLKLKEDRV